MNKLIQCGIYLLLVIIFWPTYGAPDAIKQNYLRSVPLVKAANQLAVGTWEELSVAGVNLADYDYAGVSHYAIASPSFTLFVLGFTESGTLVLDAIELGSQDFKKLIQFEAEDLQQIRIQDVNLAICFQDHPYSHERLRYVFLTYIVGREQSETYLKVFRMENDDSLTFTEMVFTTIGKTDMVYADTPDAPYTYSRQGNASEPGIQIVPRLMMADVNHDKFMDLVIWKRIYLANPRDAEVPIEAQDAYEQYVFKKFTRDREEVQVMFFDWETVSFADPVITQTEALGNDVFWRFLFPGYWIQDYYDWMESPSEEQE